jgi:hypothetical protein
MAAHAYPAPGPNPLSCPWCGAPSTPAPGTLICERCARRFTLTVGPALDGRIAVPPPHPATARITIRWSIVVTYQFATLDPIGVMSGTLDPVIAVAPMDQSGIAFTDVLSIAVWRQVAWSQLFGGLVFPLPFGLLAAWGAILGARKDPGSAAIIGVIALALLSLFAFFLRRAFVVGRRNVRIVGRHRSFTIPVQTNRWFYDELFRRCGLLAPEVP